MYVGIPTCDDNIDIVDKHMYDQGVGWHHIQRREEDEIVGQDSKTKVVARPCGRELHTMYICTCMYSVIDICVCMIKAEITM